MFENGGKRKRIRFESCLENLGGVRIREGVWGRGEEAGREESRGFGFWIFVFIFLLRFFLVRG